MSSLLRLPPRLPSRRRQGPGRVGEGRGATPQPPRPRTDLTRAPRAAPGGCPCLALCTGCRRASLAPSVSTAPRFGRPRAARRLRPAGQLQSKKGQAPSSSRRLRAHRSRPARAAPPISSTSGHPVRPALSSAFRPAQARPSRIQVATLRGPPPHLGTVRRRPARLEY